MREIESDKGHRKAITMPSKGTPQARKRSYHRPGAEVLNQHVVLEMECIDRMYLNVIVGRLQILEGPSAIHQAA